MIFRWQYKIANAQAHPRTLIFSAATILLSCYIVMANLNFGINNEVFAQPSSSTPSPPTTGTGLPTIQITSVQEGQQVPPGELTIQGVSSDTEDSDCEVFADVNDVTPMQNVTAAGESEDDEDFSTWTFTYTDDYQLISQGQNELTAKISCLSDGDLDLNSLPGAGGPGVASTASAGPLNEWHTVNVTGVAGAPPATLSSPTGGGDGEGGTPPAALSSPEDGEDGAEGEDGTDGENGADGIGGSGGDGGDSEDGGDGGDGEDGGGGNLFEGGGLPPIFGE